MIFRDYLRGFGDVLNLFSVPLPDVRPLTPEEAARADWQALSADWEAVGKDLWKAFCAEQGKAR